MTTYGRSEPAPSRAEVATAVTDALHAWVAGGDVERLIAAVAPIVDDVPERALELLLHHAPITTGVLSAQVWAEGHAAGGEDARDTSCWAMSTSNPYEGHVPHARMERALLAIVTTGAHREAVVLAGHAHDVAVVDEAARFYLHALGRRARTSEEHRARVDTPAAAALADQDGKHWWVEVGFAAADRCTAVTIVRVD